MKTSDRINEYDSKRPWLMSPPVYVLSGGPTAAADTRGLPVSGAGQQANRAPSLHQVVPRYLLIALRALR